MLPTQSHGAIAALLLAVLGSAPLPAQNPERFRKSIDAFLEADRANPPRRQAIVFTGSSIFRLWTTLPEQMAPLPVINRAFGGSQTEDLLGSMDQLVLPLEPSIVVYYCGSNDVNAGRGANAIFENFRAFADRVHRAQPNTQILYVSIIRAPDKRHRWDIVDAANTQIRTYCEKTPKLSFVDVNPAVFAPNGEPRAELYLSDNLHFKAAAYVAFTAIIKPVLESAWRHRD